MRPFGLTCIHVWGVTQLAVHDSPAPPLTGARAPVLVLQPLLSGPLQGSVPVWEVPSRFGPVGVCCQVPSEENGRLNRAAKYTG